MVKNKEKLIEELRKNARTISNDKKGVSAIKDELSNYRITKGRVEQALSRPEIIEDDRELALFTEAIFNKTKIPELDPNLWFTSLQLKDSKKYDFILENFEEDLKLPLEIRAIPSADGGYIGIITIQTLVKMLKSKLLFYNFDVQREAKRVIRNNKEEYVPKIDKQNIKDMMELLRKGELFRTTITLNANPRTSDIGEELIYNNKTGMLTITEGTVLEILDGYHRCLACEDIYEANPDLKMDFNLDIRNYTPAKEKKWQGQTAKGMRMSKARIRALEKPEYADQVIELLKTDSELEGRISYSKGKLNTGVGEIVNYIVLSNAIDREYEFKSKFDTYPVAEYLKKFFEYLFGLYPDVFMINAPNKDSLMAYNKMFAGYIALASKMQKEEVELSKIKTILDKIDFNRTNPLWKELGVTNENGGIAGKVKDQTIANYFSSLEI